MSREVFWCNHCEVPIIENSICPVCGNKCKSISTNGICNPVFLQERKILSNIIDEDITNENVWYLGSAKYLISGEKVIFLILIILDLKSIC